METFARRATKHAFSLPGHGSSSCNKKHINRYTLDDCVQTLAQQVQFPRHGGDGT
jgi:hypothetical protein